MPKNTVPPKQIKVAGKLYDLVPDKIKVGGKIYTRVEAEGEASEKAIPFADRYRSQRQEEKLQLHDSAPTSKKYYVSLPGGIQIIIDSKSSGQAMMQLRKAIKGNALLGGVLLKSLKPALVPPGKAVRIQKMLDTVMGWDLPLD